MTQDSKNLVCGWVATGVLLLMLVILASCTPISPYTAILPPGAQSKVVQAQFDAASPVRRAALGLTGSMVTLTCDFGDGPMDGITVRASFQVGNYFLVKAFDPTNVFTVALPTNQPSYVEVRSYVLWPAPYVVSTVTNDDGSTGSVTNFYRESDPSWFIYVPTNCPTIGLFAMPDGTIQLAGWATTNLTIQQSQDLTNWQDVGVITNSGAWNMPVDATQVQAFWRTSQSSP